MSDNWWRTLFATDVMTRPEVIPGHENQASLLHFENLIDSFKVSIMGRGTAGSGAKAQARSFSSKFADFFGGVVGGIVFYLIVFAPSYVYRMSIKSTAWIHWPLAYIARARDYSQDFDEIRLRLWRDPREWVRRFVMIITIFGALVASLPALDKVKDAFPGGTISLVEYAILIDIKTLFAHPGRILALLSAAITLFLTWYGCELSLLVARSAAHPGRAAQARSWAAKLEYAMRVRDVCGWLFWGLVLVHAGLWLIPSKDWLPVYLREILWTVYGEFLPSGLRT